MSFAERSSPLQTISEVELECVQTADELYYMTTEIFNPDTEEYEVFDLSLLSNIIFSIKIKSTDTVIYTTDENDGNITITDDINGKFTTEIPTADTTTLPLGSHMYDVFGIQSGKRKPLLRGNIKVVDNVTV